MSGARSMSRGLAMLPMGVSLVVAALAACSTVASAPTAAPATPATPATRAASVPPPPASARLPDDVRVEADDFVNLHDMTPVRGFFVDNLAGRLDEAVAVATSFEGGPFPVGTVIQLVPQEAMVKRAPGFSPGYGDWEFLTLAVSDQGTQIVSRGGAEVVNQFGKVSCANCHVKAEERYDFVCEKDHGCDALAVKDDVIKLLQDRDPRPRRSGS